MTGNPYDPNARPSMPHEFLPRHVRKEVCGPITYHVFAVGDREVTVLGPDNPYGLRCAIEEWIQQAFDAGAATVKQEREAQLKGLQDAWHAGYAAAKQLYDRKIAEMFGLGGWYGGRYFSQATACNPQRTPFRPKR